MSTVPKYFIQSIEDGSVTSQKLAAESVVTSKLKDANITPAKLATGVDWDVSSSTFTVATPTLTGHASTKGYVDTAVANVGLHWKEAALVATTGALTGTYTYDAASQTWTANANGALSIDSTALNAGNRILVKDETGGAQPYNGIFVVVQPGSPSVQATFKRSDDADDATNLVPGFSIYVSAGPTNQDNIYGLTTDGPITVDTTALTFVQQAHIDDLVAGDGLTKSGATLTVGLEPTGSLEFGSGTTPNKLLQLGSTLYGQKTVSHVDGGASLRQQLAILNNVASPAVDDTSGLMFKLKDANNVAAVAASVNAQLTSTAAGAIDAKLILQNVNAGTPTTCFTALSGGEVAVGAMTPVSSYQLAVTDMSVTTGSTSSLLLTKSTTGTAGPDFGTAVAWTLEMSNGAIGDAGAVGVAWKDATPATKTSVIFGTVFYNNALTQAFKAGRYFETYGGRVNDRTLFTAAGSHTLSLDHHIVGYDTTLGAITFVLPDTATVPAGLTYIIKDEGFVTATNNMIIDPHGSQTIDGITSATFNRNRTSVTIYTNGTNWFII